MNSRLTKLFIAFFTALLIPLISYAQNEPITVELGSVEIIQDYKIKELFEKSIELNSKTTVRGYRVKIHFGTEKNQAHEIKEKFVEKYPDVPSYVRYDQPFFSVKVGNYRTKLEAYKFLKQIQNEYNQAFLVQDEIDFK